MRDPPSSSSFSAVETCFLFFPLLLGVCVSALLVRRRRRRRCHCRPLLQRRRLRRRGCGRGRKKPSPPLLLRRHREKDAFPPPLLASATGLLLVLSLSFLLSVLPSFLPCHRRKGGGRRGARRKCFIYGARREGETRERPLPSSSFPFNDSERAGGWVGGQAIGASVREEKGERAKRQIGPASSRLSPPTLDRGATPPPLRADAATLALPPPPSPHSIARDISMCPIRPAPLFLSLLSTPSPSISDGGGKKEWQGGEASHCAGEESQR